MQDSRNILMVTLFLTVLLISQTSLQVLASSSSGTSDFQGTMQEWITKMHHMPDPSTGCFRATYPSTIWLEVPCAKVTDAVLPVPPTVGGGGTGSDYSANAGSSTYIGYASGSFTYVSGITGENDSLNPCNASKNGDCANWYSVQLNSNFYNPSSSIPCPDYSGYNGATSGYTCWEQFVFNNQQYGSNGYIWYVLGGYAKNIGPCSAIDTPPGMVQWFSSSSDPSQSCYSFARNVASLGPAPISQLSDISVSGASNFAGSGNDQITICDYGQNPSCNSASYTDMVLNLYKSWQVTEFNVFGYGSGSTAVFYGSGSTMTITANEDEETTSQSYINPTCDPYGYTGEKNSLWLVAGSCSTNSGDVMSFTEASYYLTTQVSGSGTVTPSSEYTYPGEQVTIRGYPGSGAQFCY